MNIKYKFLTHVLAAAVLAGALATLQPMREVRAQAQGVHGFATNVCKLNIQPGNERNLISNAFPDVKYNKFFASLRARGAGTLDMCSALKNILVEYRQDDVLGSQNAFYEGRALSAVVAAMLLSQHRNPPLRLKLAAQDMVEDHERNLPLADRLFIKYEDNKAHALKDGLNLNRMSPQVEEFYSSFSGLN